MQNAHEGLLCDAPVVRPLEQPHRDGHLVRDGARLVLVLILLVGEDLHRYLAISVVFGILHEVDIEALPEGAFEVTDAPSLLRERIDGTTGD